MFCLPLLNLCSGNLRGACVVTLILWMPVFIRWLSDYGIFPVKSTNALFFISFLALYVTIVAAAGIEDYILVKEMDKFDLNGDGMFDVKEMTAGAGMPLSLQ